MNSLSWLQDMFTDYSADGRSSAERCCWPIQWRIFPSTEMQKEDGDNTRGTLQTLCCSQASFSACTDIKVSQPSKVQQRDTSTVRLRKRAPCEWTSAWVPSCHCMYPAPQCGHCWHLHHSCSALWVSSALSRWKGGSWQAKDAFPGLQEDSTYLL